MKLRTTQDNTHELLDTRHLTESAYVLRMSRRGLQFRSGQHILLGEAGSIHNREYSVYSAEQDDYFEVLIKEVDDGLVSKQLKKLKPGSMLQLEGPLGFFTIEPGLIGNAKFLFVATGSGIAPFHSFVRSYPALNYKILHGVRYASEAYEKDTYPSEQYVLCTSQDKKGDFNGRVTSFLESNPVETDTHCYLCGNFEMIHEVFEILERQGVPPQQVHAEVYF
ncbi:MAG: FAD-binding oxidoreductase [Bacteroidales bacterium]|jgi:ferredoxin--NADP+ reductase/benzoate/toluate 1,2-dioxygenase reductase subunit|nr:FAD-binding oxidoreductase [Bacteroidales bacterium]